MNRLNSAFLVLLLATTGCSASPDISPQALRSAVAAKDADLAGVYGRLDWASAWSRDNVRDLEAALADRARHGLDHVGFFTPPSDGSPPEQLDIARTRAALGFAHALAMGRTDPHKLYKIYTLPLPRIDLVTGLAEALRERRLKAWLDGLAPQDDDYRTLSEAYLAYAEDAREGGETKIAVTGEAIKPGENDARVPEISQQLAASGYLPPEAVQASGDARFTPAVVDAVKAMQRDYGIATDGVIGQDTLDVLNMGPAARARATAVALERRRWLPRDAAPTRIDVNIAAAQLRYWRDGKLVDTRKVIVGRPDKATPQLLAPMFQLVANPTWTVPKSIQTTEMANKDAAYFRAHNMVETDGWIVQQPGPSNALGMVKFDLKDDYAIYLHDTNARSLFGRTQRQLSHGCVRVEDALGFADMIAQQEGVADEWRRARASGDETFVKLPREIPVRLLYESAFVGPQGAVQLRTDPYDWDEDVARKLGFSDRGRTAFRTDEADIGP